MVVLFSFVKLSIMEYLFFENVLFVNKESIIYIFFYIITLLYVFSSHWHCSR